MALAIIPCGNKKIWDKEGDIGPVPARKAYIGTFHQLCRAYAEMFYPRWVILSAKHGYLQPDEMVSEPYNVSFSHRSGAVIPIDRLADQVGEKGLGDFQHLVVLTGKKYKPIVQKSFGPDHHVEMPLLGSRGIGEMQQKLKRSITEGQPL